MSGRRDRGPVIAYTVPPVRVSDLDPPDPQKRWMSPLDGRVWAPGSGRTGLPRPRRGLAPRAASELTAQALLGLFHEHGPPLVIKFDNGSAFIDLSLRNGA